MALYIKKYYSLLLYFSENVTKIHPEINPKCLKLNGYDHCSHGTERNGIRFIVSIAGGGSLIYVGIFASIRSLGKKVREGKARDDRKRGKEEQKKQKKYQKKERLTVQKTANKSRSRQHRG